MAWSPRLTWDYIRYHKFCQMQKSLFIQYGLVTLELAMWVGFGTGMHHTLFPSKWIFHEPAKYLNEIDFR